MHDHHYLVIPEVGLAYGRCPNAATDGIRRALLKLTRQYPTGLDNPDHATAPEPRYATGTLTTWADGLVLLSARQLTRRYPDAIVFAAVRDPIARLAACYIRDLDRGHAIPPSGVYLGLQPGMSFTAFAARVCAIPDERSSNAYRSQASILTHKGRMLPDHVVRHENRIEDWARLRTRVERCCSVDIGPLAPPQDAEEREIAEVVATLDPTLTNALRHRYRRDFALFYGGMPIT